MKWCRRFAAKEILCKYYNGLKENHCNIKFKTAENYIKTSNRKEVEGLPEAAANVTLKMMENSQTEVANGEKKPL